MGSYGLTYRVREVERNEVFLLKQHRPSKGVLGRTLLLREAKYMRTLSHVRIPKVYAEFEENKRNFLVMTYICGYNVEDLLFEQNRTFTELEAMLFVYEIALLLQHIHQAGLVHLDVRIPNVLWNEAGVHLIDFGLARRLDEVEELSYSDLEPIDKFKQRMKKQARSSDWFALGHFLLFLLYSSYTEEELAEERSWEEELTIQPMIRDLLKHLLDSDEHNELDEQIIARIERVVHALRTGQETGC